MFIGKCLVEELINFWQVNSYIIHTLTVTKVYCAFNLSYKLL